MLGYFMAAELFHNENDDSTNQMPNVPEKLTKQNEKQATCRVCLKFGDIPIYGSQDMSEALSSFGGIIINQYDTYPKYLCQNCYSLLQSAISFRKTAQKSDKILRRPYKNSRYSDGSDSEYEDEYTEIKTQFHCERCNIDFKTFKDYRVHRLTEEHRSMRLTCPICKKTYTANSYYKHLAIHKGETRHVCDICGKKFKVKGQLTKHRAIHFNDLPFKCSLCPYRGRFSECLKTHMRTHTGEKPFQCTQCPDRFADRSNLNKHMLKHRGKKDFKCDPCGRGFYRQKDLDLHFKVDHTGVKEHVCNICGKAFGYRQQMTKHQLRVHKREKLQRGGVPLYLRFESNTQDNTE